jgi:leucyl aminopeptidase
VPALFFRALASDAKKTLAELPSESTEIVLSTQLPQEKREASSVPGRLGTETLKQLRRKLEALAAAEARPSEKARSMTAPEAKTLAVTLASGGKTVFIVLPANPPAEAAHAALDRGASPLSRFELHTALRAACEPLLLEALEAEPRFPIRIDTRALAPELERVVLAAVVFLAVAGGWKPQQFSTPAKDQKRSQRKGSSSRAEKPLTVELLSGLPQTELEALVRENRELGIASRQVRTLAELPASELTPGRYRAIATELAREAGVRCEFIDTRRLSRLGAGAFLAVARSEASSDAGILHLSYIPRKKRSGGPIVLVGKGICFDTGGYNLKPGSSMLGMHGDMTGSALALALLLRYARLRVDFEVHAFLALAQNLISPSAYKPNEIVTACDGTTIEVVDTDAEGRMVLADTLALARRLRPRLCIDFATLTGAAIRSLDTRRCAVFGNNARVLSAALQAGESSGERVWSFPIGGDYRFELRSKVADILQCHTSHNADHIYAATFLSHFIGDSTPWIHLDLSAAENKGGLGLISSDTTGFGLAWATELISLVLRDSPTD